MTPQSKLVLAGRLLLAACLLALSCGKARSDSGTDSATHWLLRCSADSECGPLQCLCGTCTKSCRESSTCPNAARAECAVLVGSECSASATACVATCQTDADCGTVRAGLQCVDGQCIGLSPGPGSGGTGGAGGAGGAGDCDVVPQCEFACPEGTINPSDENGCVHTCECVRPTTKCPNEPPCGSQCPPGTTSPVDGNGCITSCTCVAAPSDAASTDCSSIPACRFACPDGTVNPVDGNGCTHSCECVVPGTSAGSLSLFYTCGDPLCRGYTAGSGQPLCSSEQAGDLCRLEGSSCDPQDDCNRLLTCTSSDPRLRPGGCPISRRSYKTDIHYLSPEELARYRDELLNMKLATWRYKQDPAKQRLGFIIDDNESSVAVDAQRDMVDLYGYTSLAVAVLQSQAREIETLKRELAELKKARSPRSANGSRSTRSARP